jgi:hypothetical protein
LAQGSQRSSLEIFEIGIKEWREYMEFPLKKEVLEMWVFWLFFDGPS